MIAAVVTFRAVSKVSVPMRAFDPTATANVMLPPPASSVKLPEPSIRPENVIFCNAAEVLKSGAVPTSVIGPAKEITPPAVICPAKEVLPAAVWVKAPPIAPTNPEPNRAVPELLRVTPPLPVVVVTLPLNVKFVPVKLIPPIVLVISAPKLDVPMPPSCEMLPAVMAPVIMLPAELKVRLVSPVAAAPIDVLPVPLAIVSEWVPPAIDPERVTDPAPEPELIVEFAVNVMLLAKEIATLVPINVPEKFTAPTPLCSKLPPSSVEEPAVKFNVPELAILNTPPSVIKDPLIVIAAPSN